MTPIAERKALVDERLKAVKSHCMCGRFEESPTHYTVFYPEGFYPDGCRVSKGGGKWVALGHMLVVMERHWKEAQI